ncbi:glycosyltransferase family 4 protein [Calidifontibacter sp. DB0510]|uniref:D-inositol 3-phosphate glycosyltransferase n=1 Tax=Metallococcus carri TaxID=1656884 RepID=A0A967E9Q3_9MICO|nr:glycosyltransferase family 4 protein [Metallococcus carri]NHN56627.1 glycosyltransferase family 4 protein [Metallococcus carri]NOP38926.1 glycosyltransferase family 4 protein [Calidifontibacter sp. DB2511S]
MKVALISDCYLPRLGGIEVQVHDLARHLRAAGHEVTAFTATREPGQKRNECEFIDGVPVHRLAIPMPRGLPINPLAPPTLRRLLVAGQYDVAHVHLGVVAPFANDAVRVTDQIGLPTAVTWHSMQSWMTTPIKLLGYVGRWARQGVALSAVSGPAALPIMDLAGPRHPVSILPNGIDVSQWQPGERPVRATGDPVRVVSAMRLAGRKRPLELLDIVAEARRRAPEVDLRLEVLGEGPLRPRLEAAVAAKGARSWFSAPGRRTRDEVREVYRTSDLYIAPAELEAFGIAALEARTTGLPVVAPRRSGVSEFVADGVNGVLCGDDAAMVEALVRLGRDEPLRERMTETNRTQLPKESWPSVVDMVIAEYERARDQQRHRHTG